MLRLDKGSITFELDSGVTVAADAPADIELRNPMRLKLLRGGIIADVGEDGIGFTVETAAATIVDLGTRFGVDVAADHETEIVVFEGKVEVQRPEASPDDRKVMTLGGGEAARVGKEGQAKRISRVGTGGRSLALIKGGKGKPVVARVEDPRKTGEPGRFYTIIPGGMGEGSLAFANLGRPRWVPLQSKAFPPDLVGADLVCSYSGDRRDDGLRLKLELTEPAEVYVLVDARGPVPDWIRKRFKNTGEQLRSGPWNPEIRTADGIGADPDGELYVTHSVWKAVAEKAGQFHLGAARDQSTPRNRAMYSVAVKPLN